MQTKADAKSNEVLAKKLHRRSFLERYRLESRMFDEGKLTTKPLPVSEELVQADWAAREPMRTLWYGVAEEAINHVRQG